MNVMRNGLLLFMGGIDFFGATLMFVVLAIPLFFILRFWLLRVQDKRASINVIAGVLAVLMAPLAGVLIVLAISGYYASREYAMMEEMNADSIRNEIEEMYILNHDDAHPDAQKILADDFYWLMEGPPFMFDGPLNFQDYYSWHKRNSDSSGIAFFRQQMAEWDFALFDLTKSSPEEVTDLMKVVPSTIIYTADYSLMTIGFGQFVLVGKVEPGMKDLLRHAIQRQVSPAMLGTLKAYEREDRRLVLESMLADVEAMK